MVGRIVPQRVAEGEADIGGECLMRGVPPEGEVLLDGAEIHGVPDDGVVVVQLQPLDVHRRVEPHADLLLPQPRQDLRAPLPHRRLEGRGRRHVPPLPRRLRRPPPPRLPPVDVGEEGADPAELAGEPRAEHLGLPAGQLGGADRHVARRGGIRHGRGHSRRRWPLRWRRRRDAGARPVVPPRVRVGGVLGHEGDAGVGPVVVVVVVDLIPAGEHGGRHRRRGRPRRRSHDLRRREEGIAYRVSGGPCRVRGPGWGSGLRGRGGEEGNGAPFNGSAGCPGTPRAGSVPSVPNLMADRTAQIVPPCDRGQRGRGGSGCGRATRGGHLGGGVAFAPGKMVRRPRGVRWSLHGSH